jgi:hypothetical protein
VLAALVLVLTHNGILAIVAIVGAVVALLAGFVSSVRGRTPGVTLGNGRRLGKGPYAKADCPPEKVTVDRLATVARDLRQSSAASSMKLDWSEFDKQCGEAKSLTESGKHEPAIRAYARAFRALMKSIRDSQDEMASDSNIEL